MRIKNHNQNDFDKFGCRKSYFVLRSTLYAKPAEMYGLDSEKLKISLLAAKDSNEYIMIPQHTHIMRINSSICAPSVSLSKF